MVWQRDKVVVFIVCTSNVVFLSGDDSGMFK